MGGVFGKLIGEAAETILPLAGKAASPSPLALPPGKPTQGLHDSLASAMADVGSTPKNVYNKTEFDPFKVASELTHIKESIRVGDPGFPLDLNTLPIRDYDPVVHKVRINKGQTIEEAMPADLSKMKAFDIIDLSGEGTRRQRRLFEVMPDGSIVRFKGNRPFAETTMKTVKRYGTKVLEFKNQWVNEAVTKTGKRVRPGQLGSMQMRAAGEKAVRAFGIPEAPLEPGQFGVTSQGRARTMAEMQREELGPLAKMVGYTADAFADVLINKSVPGDINWGRLNSRGKLGVTKAIQAKRYSNFKENGVALFTTGFQKLHEPLMSSSRNRFKTQRERNILKAFDRMAYNADEFGVSSEDTYAVKEKLMLSLLDMMPDEMVDRLAISVRKQMPDASGHYVNHPAAGIMTLTLKDSDVHTFFHEFMHHIQTFIAPEDLEGLASQFKRALMAEDAQGLISTLYYSARTRIRNEADLRIAIKADPDLLKQWVDMRGGALQTVGLGATIARRPPTDADWNAIITIMKNEGKLPPNFEKAAVSSFDISKYGPEDLPWIKDEEGGTTLGGAFPAQSEIDQLQSMLYRYTNFNEYLAEVFADRMLVNAAAKMLRDEKYIGLFDRILELLADWFIGAYNWALRHGRKDLVDDIIRRIQRGDFNSMTYDKAQRELERPYDTWLSETGGQRGYVAGSAMGEITSGMGGPKKSVFDTLGRAREIEGGEQGGGAFAQSPQLQPSADVQTRRVATEVERAEMNEYLRQAREKWGVGPLGHRQTGLAGQELAPPYQPQSMPVEKTEMFLRDPMGTVRQESRTGRLQETAISGRAIEGRSPEATPSKFPEGSDEWVNEQARTVIDAYMSGSITGNEAGSRIIDLKRMVRERDMARAKAEGTATGLSTLYSQLERTGDQLQGGYIDDAGAQPLKDILPPEGGPVGGGPVSRREQDLTNTLNREVEGLISYGMRNEFVERKRGPAYMFIWSNAQAKWSVGRNLPVGKEVRLDANHFIGYGKRADLEAVAERLDPLPLFSGGPKGGSFEYRSSQTPSGGGMPMRKDITDYLGKIGEAGTRKPPQEPPSYG